MIRPNLRSVLIALLLAPPAAHADTVQLGRPPQPAKPLIVDTTATIAVEPLAPGVYAAKMSYVWTGWVELPEGILVIDTGFNEHGAKALADTIRARSGKDRQPIAAGKPHSKCANPASRRIIASFKSLFPPLSGRIAEPRPRASCFY